MNVVIYESFVGISFFVSDFDFAKSGNEKYRMFWEMILFLFFLKTKQKIENLIPTKEGD